jgi:hypothetical protein
MNNAMGVVNEQLLGYGFWLEVQGKHPDALKIKASDEWSDWIGGQSKTIKSLATSTEVEDTIKILDYYKEDQARAGAAKKDKKDRSAKKKKDDLHKHSSRSKAEVSGKGTKASGDKDDEEAGWNEAGKS